jgi:phenylacetate-CoA ligase
VDGLLVDPSDPVALSAAILEILNDDSLARRIRAAGLKLVEERYSWKSIARQTLSFYEKYASARPERL